MRLLLEPGFEGTLLFILGDVLEGFAHTQFVADLKLIFAVSKSTCCLVPNFRPRRFLPTPETLARAPGGRGGYMMPAALGGATEAFELIDLVSSVTVTFVWELMLPRNGWGLQEVLGLKGLFISKGNLPVIYPEGEKVDVAPLADPSLSVRKCLQALKPFFPNFFIAMISKDLLGVNAIIWCKKGSQ